MITLTTQECQTIIELSSKSTNIAVSDFSAEHFGDFLGFLGEYYRLSITASVNNNQPQSLKFFVKSLPILDLRSRRSMLISSGIFRKEAKIYEKILARFTSLEGDSGEAWCPQVCLVRDDLIVFSDLTLAGFRVLPDSVVDFEAAYVEATLKALASFHACSIAFERQQRVSIGAEFSEILFETSVKDFPWFHAGLTTIVKIAQTRFSVDDSEALYQRLMTVIDLMEQSPDGVPRVLCHRDTWKNNLMFKSDSSGVHCVLIDFQTARYLSLTIDVNMAVILATRRKHHELMRRHYLEMYYRNLSESLNRHGIDIGEVVSFENFTNGCEFHRKVLLVYKAIAVMLTQPPQELFKDFTEADYRDFAQGDRCRLVLAFMERDKVYEECLLEAVGRIVDEYCR